MGAFWPSRPLGVRNINNYHKTLQEFEDQVNRDNLKRILCARKGVRLAEIVANGDMDKEIASFREQCKKFDVTW